MPETPEHLNALGIAYDPRKCVERPKMLGGTVFLRSINVHDPHPSPQKLSHKSFLYHIAAFVSRIVTQLTNNGDSVTQSN
jgi:hypothetical protein